MGIAEQIRQAYRRIDTRLGGILPGGAPLERATLSPTEQAQLERTVAITKTIPGMVSPFYKSKLRWQTQYLPFLKQVAEHAVIPQIKASIAGTKVGAQAIYQYGVKPYMDTQVAIAKAEVAAAKLIGKEVVVPAAQAYSKYVVQPQIEATKWVGKEVVVPAAKAAYQYGVKPYMDTQVAIAKAEVAGAKWLGKEVVVPAAKAAYKYGVKPSADMQVAIASAEVAGAKWLGKETKEHIITPGIEAGKGVVQKKTADFNLWIDRAVTAQKEQGLVGEAQFIVGSALTAQGPVPYMNPLHTLSDIYEKKYDRNLAFDAATGPDRLGGIPSLLKWISDKNLDYQTTKGELATEKGRAALDKRYGTDFSKMNNAQAKDLLVKTTKQINTSTEEILLLRGEKIIKPVETAAAVFGGWPGRATVAVLEAPNILQDVRDLGWKEAWNRNSGTVATLGLSSGAALAPKAVSWGASTLFGQQVGASLTTGQQILSTGAKVVDKTFVPYFAASANVPQFQAIQTKISKPMRKKIADLEAGVYNKPNVKAVQDAMNVNFGNLYSDRINSGALTYEDAVKDYVKSDVYKNYADKMGKEYAQSESWGTGAKILGLKLGDWLTPETATESLKTAGTYVALFKAFPYAFQALKGYSPVLGKTATYGLTSTIGVSQGKKFLDPFVSKSERIKSGLFAGLALYGLGAQAKADIKFLMASRNFNSMPGGPSGFKQIGIREGQKYGPVDKKGIIHEQSSFATRATVAPTRVVNGKTQYLQVFDKNTQTWSLPGGGKEFIPVNAKGKITAKYYTRKGVHNIKDYWDKMLNPAEKLNVRGKPISYRDWLSSTKLSPRDYSRYWDTMKPALRAKYGSYSNWMKVGAPEAKYVRTASTLDTMRKELGEELGLKSKAIFNKLKAAEIDSYTGLRLHKVAKIDITGIKNIKARSDISKIRWVNEKDLLGSIGKRKPSAWSSASVQSKGLKGALKEIFLRGGGRTELDSANILLKDVGTKMIQGDLAKATLSPENYDPKVLQAARKWIATNYGKQFVPTYTPKEAVTEYLLATNPKLVAQFGTGGLAGAPRIQSQFGTGSFAKPMMPRPGETTQAVWYGTKTSSSRAVIRGEGGQFKTWVTRGKISTATETGKPVEFRSLVDYGPGSRYRLDLPGTMQYIKVKTPELLLHGTPTTFKEKVGDVIIAKGSPQNLQEGIFFQPPTYPGGGLYVGTSYLGTGKEKGFTLVKGSPQVVSQLRFNPPYGRSIKMLSGYELEAIEKGGTSLKVVFKGSNIPYSGMAISNIQVQKVPTVPGVGTVEGNIPTSSLRNLMPVLNPTNVVSQTVSGITSTSAVPKTIPVFFPLPSEERIQPTPSFSPTPFIPSEEAPIVPSDDSFPQYGPSSYSPTPAIDDIIPPLGPSEIPERPADPFKPIPSEPRRSYGPGESLLLKPKGPVVYPRLSRKEEEKKKFIKKKKKKKEGYYVITKKFKKSQLITPRPLVKGQALAFGLKYAKKTERATFKLVKAGAAPVRIALKPITELEVYKAGFRPPVKKGKVTGVKNIFVQRRPTRMGTKLETTAIQKYKGRPYWNKQGTKIKRPKVKSIW